MHASHPHSNEPRARRTRARRQETAVRPHRAVLAHPYSRAAETDLKRLPPTRRRPTPRPRDAGFCCHARRPGCARQAGRGGGVRAGGVAALLAAARRHISLPAGEWGGHGLRERHVPPRRVRAAPARRVRRLEVGEGRRTGRGGAPDTPAPHESPERGTRAAPPPGRLLSLLLSGSACGPASGAVCGRPTGAGRAQPQPQRKTLYRRSVSPPVLLPPPPPLTPCPPQLLL